MATPFRLKRSAVSGKRPSLTDLQLGELALNTYDGYLFAEVDTSGVGIGTTVSLLTPWRENFGAASIYYLNSVGVGTTNPTSKLQVEGDTLVSGVVTSVGGFNLGIQSGGTSVTTGVVTSLNFVGAGNTFYYNSSTKTVDINIGGSQWTFVSPSTPSTSDIYRINGNVGIGTATPAAKLNVVHNSSTDALRITQLGSGNALVVEDETNPDATPFVVTGTGFVGIGTTNPTNTLTVSGNTSVSGLTTTNNLYVAGVGTFLSSGLNIRNPANTFGYTITGGAITTDRTLNLPVITGTDTVAVLGLSQTFSGTNTFSGAITLTGTINLTGTAAGISHRIATNQTTSTLTLGGTSGTGLIIFGQSTASQQTDIQAGATASGNTKTINLGTGGLSGSFTNINIGPTAGVGTVVINSGTNLGIATTNPTSKLHVIGDALVSGVVTATTFIGALTGIAASATQLVTPRTFEITGDVVASPIFFDGTGNVSLAATIQPNSVGLGTDTTGDYVTNISGTANQITVTGGTGESSTPTLSIPNQFTVPQDLTVTRDVQINRNLNVTGNITIGGTSASLFTTEFKVYDPDIVLGVRTDAFGNDVSNDNTANHGGIAIASTEGTPLVSLYNTGIGETNPATYKKIMWFKSGSWVGLNTDAWLINYAVGIGSTQFPTGTRLAAGNVQFTQDDLAVVRNINSSGISTLGVTTVRNGLSANELSVSGVSTFAGITTVTGTTLFSRQLNVSGVSTLGVTTITNGLSANELSVSGVSTFAGITTVTGTTLFSRQLNVSGVSTLGVTTITNGLSANELSVSGITTISVNSSSDALRITQVGSGNALVVEDSTNPDATPFVIDSIGRVGIGTTLVGTKLYVRDENQNSNTYSSEVYRTSTNFSSGVGHRAYYESYYTTAGVQTSYASGINAQVSASVAAGSTNNGYIRAGLDAAWRNNLNAQSSTDNGTLAYLYGRGIQYGHFNDNAVSPITNTATGLYLTPYCQTGSIGTLIGIDINSVATAVGATATNVRGINCEIDTTDGTNPYNLYIGGNANNYIAGNVGIGTTNPGAKLNVVDNSSSDALRITQTGSGNALVVEDSTNPDATRFVILPDGKVGVGTTGLIQYASGASDTSTFGILAPTGNDGAFVLKGNNGSTTDGSGQTLALLVGSTGGTGSGTIITHLSHDTSGIGTRRNAIRFTDNQIRFEDNVSGSVDVTINSSGSGELLVGRTSSTGTSNQLLQVEGGAYVSGSVGIGTTNPGAKLNLVDNSFSDALRITQTGSGNALVVEDSANPDATPFVVGAAGSVGIGTTNPITPLHISDGNGEISTALYTSDYLTISAQNTAPGFNIIAAGSASAQRGVFKATRARGTLSSPTVPLVNDDTFSLLGTIYDGSTGRATAAVNMEVDGDVGVGTAPQRITFWTGIGSSRLERARITSTGNIGIGTTNPTNKLEVYGDIGVGTSYNYRLGLQNSNAYNIGFNSTSALIWGLQTSGGITTTLTITGWGDGNAYIDNRNSGDIYFRNTGSNLSNSSALVFKSGGTLLIGSATSTGIANQTLQVHSGGAYISGSVGIGTTNPTAKLEPVDTAANPSVAPVVFIQRPNNIVPASIAPTNADLRIKSHSSNVKIYAEDHSANPLMILTGSGNLGIGTTNPQAKLHVIGDVLFNNTTAQGSVTVVGSTTSAIGIHSALGITTYRSVEYTIQATQGTNFHVTKILALHNGTTAYHSEYGTVYNNTSVATFDVDVSGGNIRLLATGASASSTNYVVNFVATKL